MTMTLNWNCDSDKLNQNYSGRLLLMQTLSMKENHTRQHCNQPFPVTDLKIYSLEFTPKSNVGMVSVMAIIVMCFIYEK